MTRGLIVIMHLNNELLTWNKIHLRSEHFQRKQEFKIYSEERTGRVYSFFMSHFLQPGKETFVHALLNGLPRTG